MTAQQWVGLGVRLFAIWLGIDAAARLFAFAAVLARSGLAMHADILLMQSMNVVYGGIELIVAVLLWLFPLVVAAALLPRTRHDDVLRLSAEPAAAVGCVLLGLWALATALPDVAYWLSFLVAWSRRPSDFISDPARALTVVSVAVQVGIALVLILRSRTIARWCLTLGTKAAPMSDEEQAT
jgi:hypothetical protein